MDEATKSRISSRSSPPKSGQRDRSRPVDGAGIVAQSGGYVEVYSELAGHNLQDLPAGAGRRGNRHCQPLRSRRWRERNRAGGGGPGDVRRYVVAVLKEYGYRAIPAENAGEALLFSERERIDLLLTDVVMPNMSGRNWRPAGDTPASRQGAVHVRVHRQRVEHLGPEEGAMFIQKPFSPEELAGKVRAVLQPPEAPTPRTARILVADDEASVAVSCASCWKRMAMSDRSGRREAGATPGPGGLSTW